MMTQLWTNHEVRDLTFMWVHGDKISAIIKKLPRRSFHAVSKKAKDLGLPTRPRGGKPKVWNDTKFAFISERKAIGQTYQQIADELGVTRKAMMRALQRRARCCR